MATYVSLLKYTQQGIADIKNGPDRVDAARQGIEAAGGKMISYYLTMGQHDAVVIVEFPDDATAAQTILRVSMQGNVGSETMKAFGEDEFRSLVSGL